MTLESGGMFQFLLQYVRIITRKSDHDHSAKGEALLIITVPVRKSMMPATTSLQPFGKSKCSSVAGSPVHFRSHGSFPRNVDHTRF